VYSVAKKYYVGIPMSDEVKQLKRKVKLQRILIGCMSITLACMSILLAISVRESRTDDYKLEQMKVQVEQLKKDFQKIEKAIEFKVETET